MASSEKVICSLCETTIIKKNLKIHYNRRHPGKTINWKSAVSNDVRTFFPDNLQVSKKKDDENDLEQFSSDENVGNKRPRLETESILEDTPSRVADCGDFSSANNFQEILSAIQGLSSQIQELKSDKNKRQDKPAKAKLTSETNFTSEEREILLKSSRSIESILKWADTFERCNEGLKCNVCQTVLKFNFENGDNFDENNMPVTFRHLKYDLCRHLNTVTHCENLLTAKELSIREKEALETGKLAALNCASAAYLSYKLQSSYRDFETILTEFYNSGAEVGLKNHSKEFARNFLPSIYTILKKEIASFIIANKLPIGIVADKMTSNRRSRHIIGLRVPVFDINHKSFFQCIYLEHNAVTDFTGEGLSCSILSTIEKFGLDLSYIREHLTGLAVDGQYVNLDVTKHLKHKLAKDIVVSWDPMHKIELIKKHADVPKIVADAFQLIHDTMKHFSTGKSYEMLLKNFENYDNYFYKPKLFKTMKFLPYSEDVFKTFICDYPVIVSSCEQDPDGYVLRDLLMNKETLFNILVLSDICYCLGKTSRKVQNSDLFPWQYMSFIQSMISSLKIMQQYLEELSISLTDSTNTNFVALLKKLPSHLFSSLKKSIEMFDISQDMTSTFLGVPLPEKPVSSKSLRLHDSFNKTALLKNNLSHLAKYTASIIKQADSYFSENECKNKVTAFGVAKHLNFLFNNDFLLYPQTTANVYQADSVKGLNEVSFNGMLDEIPFVSKDKDIRCTLWFEFSIFNEWMYSKLYSYICDGNTCSQKLLYKKSFHELSGKIPTFMNFFASALSVPVSEAICETWGSIIDQVNKQRLRSADGNEDDIGTNDKRTFIKINGPPSGYKNTRKCLKAALTLMYGLNYSQHFTNVHRSKTLGKFVTSKVVNRINNEAECLPCFK